MVLRSFPLFVVFIVYDAHLYKDVVELPDSGVPFACIRSQPDEDSEYDQIKSFAC